MLEVRDLKGRDQFAMSIAKTSSGGAGTGVWWFGGSEVRFVDGEGSRASEALRKPARATISAPAPPPMQMMRFLLRILEFVVLSLSSSSPAETS